MTIALIAFDQLNEAELNDVVRAFAEPFPSLSTIHASHVIAALAGDLDPINRALDGADGVHAGTEFDGSPASFQEWRGAVEMRGATVYLLPHSSALGRGDDPAQWDRHLTITATPTGWRALADYSRRPSGGMGFAALAMVKAAHTMRGRVHSPMEQLNPATVADLLTLHDIYDLIATDPRAALRSIYKLIDDILHSGQMERADRVMGMLDADRLNPTCWVGVLAITRLAASFLPRRAAFAGQVIEEMERGWDVTGRRQWEIGSQTAIAIRALIEPLPLEIK